MASHDNDPPDDSTIRIDIGSLVQAAGASETAFLTVLGGPLAGKIYPIDQDKLSIGRDASADIHIEDKSISRVHAHIERVLGRTIIHDAGSTNGVFVNGRQVHYHDMQNGDRVQIGSNVVLKYSLTDEMEERLQKQLYESATRDRLTGAFSRRFVMDQLALHFERSQQHDIPLSLLMMDLDHFKSVNDDFSHLAGDQVLRTFARLVQVSVRGDDIFARYGGEEFMVVLCNTPRALARLVAERIRQSIEAHDFTFEGDAIPVTVSIGFDTFENRSHDSVEALIQAADTRLYEAKHGGRNRVAPD